MTIVITMPMAGLPADAPAGYWHDTGHAELKQTMGLLEHRSHLAAMAPRLIGFHLHDVSAEGRDHLVMPGWKCRICPPTCYGDLPAGTGRVRCAFWVNRKRWPIWGRILARDSRRAKSTT